MPHSNPVAREIRAALKDYFKNPSKKTLLGYRKALEGADEESLMDSSDKHDTHLFEILANLEHPAENILDLLHELWDSAKNFPQAKKFLLLNFSTTANGIYYPADIALENHKDPRIVQFCFDAFVASASNSSESWENLTLYLIGMKSQKINLFFRVIETQDIEKAKHFLKFIQEIQSFLPYFDLSHLLVDSHYQRLNALSYLMLHGKPDFLQFFFHFCLDFRPRIVILQLAKNTILQLLGKDFGSDSGSSNTYKALKLLKQALTNELLTEREYLEIFLLPTRRESVVLTELLIDYVDCLKEGEVVAPADGRKTSEQESLNDYLVLVHRRAYQVISRKSYLQLWLKALAGISNEVIGMRVSERLSHAKRDDWLRDYEYSQILKDARALVEARKSPVIDQPANPNSKSHETHPGIKFKNSKTKRIIKMPSANPKTQEIRAALRDYFDHPSEKTFFRYRQALKGADERSLTDTAVANRTLLVDILMENEHPSKDVLALLKALWGAAKNFPQAKESLLLNRLDYDEATVYFPLDLALLYHRNERIAQFCFDALDVSARSSPSWLKEYVTETDKDLVASVKKIPALGINLFFRIIQTKNIEKAKLFFKFIEDIESFVPDFESSKMLRDSRYGELNALSCLIMGEEEDFLQWLFKTLCSKDRMLIEDFVQLAQDTIVQLLLKDSIFQQNNSELPNRKVCKALKLLKQALTDGSLTKKEYSQIFLLPTKEGNILFTELLIKFNDGKKSPEEETSVESLDTYLVPVYQQQARDNPLISRKSFLQLCSNAFTQALQWDRRTKFTITVMNIRLGQAMLKGYLSNDEYEEISNSLSAPEVSRRPADSSPQSEDQASSLRSPPCPRFHVHRDRRTGGASNSSSNFSSRETSSKSSRSPEEKKSSSNGDFFSKKKSSSFKTLQEEHEKSRGTKTPRSESQETTSSVFIGATARLSTFKVQKTDGKIYDISRPGVKLS